MAPSFGLQVDESRSTKIGYFCREAEALAESRLPDVRERLRDLRGTDSVLSAVLRACHTDRGKASGPLIAMLQQADPS